MTIGGMEIDPISGQLKFPYGSRVAQTTDGTLINLLSTLRSWTGKVLTFPQPPMDYAYGWSGSQNWGFNPDPNIPDSYAQNNQCQVWFTALGQEYQAGQTLMAAPAGADIFFGFVKLTRTAAPGHTWYGRNLDPVLPVGQWIPWNGSGMLEAGFGLTRLMHLAIEGGNLRLTAQQSVSDKPMGGLPSEFGAYPSIFTFKGDKSGGHFMYGTTPGFVVWMSTAAPYRKSSNRTINTDSTPSGYATHERGAPDQCSTVNPTNYVSTYSVDVKGYFGRRS